MGRVDRTPRHLAPRVLAARGSVLVEVFNCGHWSRTYRNFAEETGVQYVHVRDPARGCQKDFGKLIGNTDRALDYDFDL